MSFRLDVRVDDLTVASFVGLLQRETPQGPRLFLNHNLHSLYLFETDARFRALYDQAEVVVADGMPVIALAKAKVLKIRAQSRENRFGSTDWIDYVVNAGTYSGRIALIGGTAPSLAHMVDHLSKSLPRAKVSGWDGYGGRIELEQSKLEGLREFKPDLVLVGLGMPRQEYFLLDNMGFLPAAIYATVGGAFDYYSGIQTLAPRWMGAYGLEWLWRLSHSPLRLGHRYLVEPVKLAWRWTIG
jgi:N-acetylglucosaminyldiphosphoundecaprenol N-acetyl-beta-D-mannosaminyltransferase